MFHLAPVRYAARAARSFFEYLKIMLAVLFLEGTNPSKGDHLMKALLRMPRLA
jgi:hypothetical protein